MIIKTKYKKVLDILDREIRITRRCYNACMELRDNPDVTLRYMHELDALCDLRMIIKRELGE